MVNKENMGYRTMRSLFRLEVETTTATLYEQLTSLKLKTQPQSPQLVESMVRAVYALKGAARLVEVDPAIELAHAMEESLTAVLKQNITLSAKQVDVLVNGVNWLVNLSQAEEENFDSWFSQQQQRLANVQQSLASLLTPGVTVTPEVAPVVPPKQETPQQHQAVDATVPETNVHAITLPEPTVNNISNSEKSSISPDYIIQNPISQTDIPTSTGGDEGASMSGTSMLDLFRLEVEAQTAILNEGLLALESEPQSGKALEALMRAAHSIKGAARIVALDAAVNLAHVMEDCFVAAQNQTITLGADEVDVLLHGVDLLINISQVEDGGMNRWLSENGQDIAATRQNIAAILTPGAAPVVREQKKAPENIPAPTQSLVKTPTQLPLASNTTPATPVKTEPTKLDAQKLPADASSDRVVRVSAENLNRIMGLAGESLIEANWLQPFADSLMILKKRQLELSKMLEELQNTLPASHIHKKGDNYLEVVKAKERECREILLERINELELYARRTSNLSDRLYREVIASNMRPFADGVQGFPRMIRDLARKLGKQVKFEIIGKSTPVDRDILKKLEAPLTHILRNSVDHGLETPDIRSAAGKPAEGTVKLEAVHRGGMLSITITDDGKGINFDWLRQKIISKSLSTPELVAQMSESELLEFIFLPGFSTAKQVTDTYEANFWRIY